MAIIMIPILIFGNHYEIFTMFCLILSMIAAFEFRNMLQKKNPLPRWIDTVSVVLTGGFLLVVVYSLEEIIPYSVILIFFIFILLLYSMILVFCDSFQTRDFGNVFATILYCSLGFAAFAYLRTVSLEIVFYFLLVSMATDTFAYLFGIKFGKHRLALKISPKKSVEGAIAGLVFGSIFATLFALFFNVFDFFIVYVILLSIFLSLMGQIGDLVASKFKRNYEIKDYSNLFPGHGGVLDRFDSSTIVALSLILILLLQSVI